MHLHLDFTENEILTPKYMRNNKSVLLVVSLPQHRLSLIHFVRHKVLVGKPEGKRTLGSPRRRWEDNIKMDLQEVGKGLGTGWSWLRIGTGGGRL